MLERCTRHQAPSIDKDWKVKYQFIYGLSHSSRAKANDRNKSKALQDGINQATNNKTSELSIQFQNYSKFQYPVLLHTVKYQALSTNKTFQRVLYGGNFRPFKRVQGSDLCSEAGPALTVNGLNSIINQYLRISKYKILVTNQAYTIWL